MSLHVSARSLCLAVAMLGARAQSGCGPQASVSEPPPPDAPEPVVAEQPAAHTLDPVVEAYFDAVRRNDLRTIECLLHPDFQSIAVRADDAIVAATGRQEMIDGLFASFEWPGLRYETLDWMTSGKLVSVSVLEILTHPPEPVEPGAPFVMVFDLEPEGIRRIWSTTTPPPDAPH